MNDHNSTEHENCLVSFLNTRADEWGRRERFHDSTGLHEWLNESGWFPNTHAESLITDTDAAEARELRDALVEIICAHTTQGVDTHSAEQILHRARSRYPLTVSITRDVISLQPLPSGHHQVFPSLLCAVYELSATRRWSRLKICRTPRCQCAFIDQSRNSSAAFCGPRCSSRTAMRAYRARRAAE